MKDGETPAYDGTAPTTNPRVIVTVVAVVAALVAGVYWLWPKPLDVSHTSVEISASSKFTSPQLDALVQAVYRENAGMTNCGVDKVRYDERRSERIIDMEIESYDEGHASALGGAVRQHGRGGAAVVFVDMTCREHVDDEDHVEWFMLLPQPNGTTEWVLQDRGNG